MEIKTRFAPSPTGYLHIGSAKIALYSWLFARNHGGKFVLRIEDTDVKRSTPEAIKDIIESMKWLGLEWDEGPYFQTKRFDRYRTVINEMIEAGTAYKCYCSKKRLLKLRKEQIAQGKKPRYDGYCRYNHKYHTNNELYAIRFANPKKGSVIFNDQIRGLIKFNNQELDDLIICRADGVPTYNFCVVIDDWDMAITHVIRGEDHINNTPRQINMLKALNAPIPDYAHVSIVNNDNNKKFSKRYGAVSIMKYRDDGYLPEALLNYLIRLGWSSGNQEIFNREEMIKLFSLNTVGKSTSMFDINKLQWLNCHYINTLPLEYVAMHLQQQIKKENIDIRNGPKLSELIKLLGKRFKTLKDIAKNCRYFYEEFNQFNIDVPERYLCQVTRHPLEVIRDKLVAISEWTVDNIHYAIQATINELSIEMNKIGIPLRIAITGSKCSPALDITIHAIGKSRSVERINKALDFIAENEIKK